MRTHYSRRTPQDHVVRHPLGPARMRGKRLQLTRIRKLFEAQVYQRSRQKTVVLLRIVPRRPVRITKPETTPLAAQQCRQRSQHSHLSYGLTLKVITSVASPLSARTYHVWLPGDKPATALEVPLVDPR